MQNCYSYFEEANVNPYAQWLLNRWTRAWESAGFRPVTLTRWHAEAHPRFKEILALAQAFPTTNPKAYEVACFIRWCAYAQCDGLEPLFLDTDCLPIDMSGYSEMIGYGELTFLDYNRVPCAVAGKKSEIARVLDWFAAYKVPAGCVHVSDMTICNAHTEARAVDWVREFTDNRPGGKLIHFSNSSCNGDKRGAIEKRLG